jgi:hypothetical protein
VFRSGPALNGWAVFVRVNVTEEESQMNSDEQRLVNSICINLIASLVNLRVSVACARLATR